MKRTLLLLALTFLVAVPLSAQRMCTGVPSPTRADTGKKLAVQWRPTPTSLNAVCLVRDTVTPPLPPPPVVTTPPPVFTGTWPLMTDRGPTLSAPGWGLYYDQSSVTVTNDPTGQPSLAMRFPAGYVGGSSPATMAYEGFSTSRIRWESTLSYPENYVKHPTGVDKHTYVYVNDRGLIFTAMYDATRLKPVVGVQGIVNLGVTAWLPQNLASVELIRGRRHLLACEAVGNTSGQANGTVECWLDGVKFLSKTGIQFTQEAAKFTGVQWAPIWGGGGGILAAAQSVYLARLRVYGQ